VRSEFHHEPDEDDFLAVLEEETGKLNGMVNATIDMARIEPGRARLRCRLLLVADLAHSSIRHPEVEGLFAADKKINCPAIPHK
jgi:K+-sensing histidine kinase KdpD